MKTEIRNALRLPAIALIAILTATQTTFAAAQDDGTQAAQQAIQTANQIAIQQSTMAAQQATQQALDAATQASQQALQNTTSPGISTSLPQRPPLPATPINGPVPAQIAAAHTVYLQNDGTDPGFPMDETIAVHDVYAALQGWGHFQFVDTPNQADLIFVLRNAAPISGAWTSDDGTTYSFTSPTFVLTIVDAKSNATLWVVTSPVPVQGSRSKQAKWFDIGVQNLVSRLKVLVGQPLDATEQADLTTYPQSHFGRNAAILTGVIVGAGVAGGLILHHEFDKSVADQKQSGLEWCENNHVPLAQCPANY